MQNKIMQKQRAKKKKTTQLTVNTMSVKNEWKRRGENESKTKKSQIILN